jgi:hypothetical protein
MVWPDGSPGTSSRRFRQVAARGDLRVPGPQPDGMNPWAGDRIRPYPVTVQRSVGSREQPFAGAGPQRLCAHAAIPSRCESSRKRTRSCNARRPGRTQRSVGKGVPKNRWFWVRSAGCWKPRLKASLQRRSARGISEQRRWSSSGARVQPA